MRGPVAVEGQRQRCQLQVGDRGCAIGWSISSASVCSAETTSATSATGAAGTPACVNASCQSACRRSRRRSERMRDELVAVLAPDPDSSGSAVVRELRKSHDVADRGEQTVVAPGEHQLAVPVGNTWYGATIGKTVPWPDGTVPSARKPTRW